MAKDAIHEIVKEALENDGWKITEDPFVVPTGGARVLIGLEAERVIAAELNGEKIAVEIKSLTGVSIIYTFYSAFGQYMFYRDALNDEEIEMEVYMAISHIAFRRLFRIPFLQKRIKQYGIKFIVVDVFNKSIINWIK